MFDELYDAISFLGSWRWPEAQGEVTAVAIDKRTDSEGNIELRLAVAYKFSVDADGPYTGESFWKPGGFCSNRKVISKRRKIRVRQLVAIRFRPDDPSVNRLDRREWRGP